MLKGLLPTDLTKFFRYSGSLTTPGCFESVTWTVFKDVVKISQYQVPYCVPRTLDSQYTPGLLEILG